MQPPVNKKVIAVVTVFVFLMTFSAFLVANGGIGYDRSGTNALHPQQFSPQNNLVNNPVHTNKDVIRNTGSSGTILGKPTINLNDMNAGNVSHSFSSYLKYNISITETGLNLSCAKWEVNLIGTIGTFTESAFTVISSSSTASLNSVILCPYYTYKLSFAVSSSKVSYDFVPLYSLNMSVVLISGQYNYLYTVNFPTLYQETFTFTDISSSGTSICGTISFNNTTSQFNFLQCVPNDYLVLPADHYRLVFSYNYSEINLTISVSGKASYSLEFTLYKVEIAVSSKYSISSDKLMIEKAVLNPLFLGENSLNMQLSGNNTFVANLGNGSYTILLIYPITYTINGYLYSDTLIYALDQDFVLSGGPLSLSGVTPALTTHFVTFTGVSHSIYISLKYVQPYACGYTGDLYYNSTTGTMSENITTLCMPFVMESCIENSSYLYHLSFYFDSATGANITVPLHKVSVDVSGTVAGSQTCFAVNNQMKGTFADILFGNAGELFFNIGSNNATFYLPSSGAQIQVKNYYTYSDGDISQTFTYGVTQSTQLVDANFLTLHNISLSLPLSYLPSGFSYSVKFYGSEHNIMFSSLSDGSCIVSPYGNISVYLAMVGFTSQSYLTYCHSVYTDISTNSLALNIQPLYMHTIEIANPVVNVKGKYSLVFAVSSTKLTSLNCINPYSPFTSNVSTSDVSVNSSSGSTLNVTFVAQNGTYNAYLVLVNYTTPSFISEVFAISYSFFSVGTLSFNSTSILSGTVSVPLLASATITISLNGLPLPAMYASYGSASGNVFGFVYAEIPCPSNFFLAVKNFTLETLLPVATSVQLTMYNTTPFISYDPEYQSCTVSNHTDYLTKLVLHNQYTVINKYKVNFVESGLTSGTAWSVTFNGTTNESTTDMITFTVANGSYQFTVASISGYTVTPASGTVIVNGSSVTENITFTVKSTITKYRVSFVETGLPAGTSWSITIDSMTNSSTGNTISFMLPDGNYSYMSTNTANYTYSGPATVVVKGSNVTIDLTFSQKSTTTTPPPSVSVSFSPVILYAIAAVVVVGIIGFVFRAMRKR